MLQSVLFIYRLFSWFLFRLFLLDSTQLLFRPFLVSLPFFGRLPLHRLRILAKNRGMVTPTSLMYCSSVVSKFSNAFFTLFLLINSVMVSFPSKSMSFSTILSNLEMNSSQSFFLLLIDKLSGYDFDRFLLAHTRTRPSLLKQIIYDSISKKPYFSYNFQNPWEAAQMMQSPSSREMSCISQSRSGMRSKKTDAQWKLLQSPVSLRLWMYLDATRQRHVVLQSMSSLYARYSPSELNTRLYFSTSTARLSLFTITLKLLPQYGSLSLVKQLTGRLYHYYSLKLLP